MTFGEASKAGLIRPGVRIRFLGREYLVGDINESGGVCDDCAAVRWDDEIEVL